VRSQGKRKTPYDVRTWEAIPRFDMANPPDKNRPRPVLHTARIPDARGMQRCVRCGIELPESNPPYSHGTVVTLGEGKSYDSVMCAGPTPARSPR